MSLIRLFQISQSFKTMGIQMLHQRAGECLARLQNAEQAKSGVDEAAALDALHRELSATAKRFHETCTKARVLMSAAIRVAPPADLTKQKQTVTNVASRFREKPEAATLKQGKRWQTLVAAVVEAAESINASLTASWQTYVGSNLFAGPPPEEEERSLARTPGNRRAMETYRRLFEQFSRLRSSVPAMPESIAHLRKLSDELSAIRFQRDVPHSVRDFLDATGTTNGAGLNLLTDEVRRWLADNGLLESYVVRARIY
jgi:hypothetical protein